VGCYIWYTEEEPGQAAAPPSPLLAVPHVTAHPSTANVPITIYYYHYITVLLYDGPLLCGFNVAIKELTVLFYHFCHENNNICYAVQAAERLLISLTWQLGYRMIQKHVRHVLARVTQHSFVGAAKPVAFVQHEREERCPVHVVLKHNQTTNKAQSLQQNKTRNLATTNRLRSASGNSSSSRI